MPEDDAFELLAMPEPETQASLDFSLSDFSSEKNEYINRLCNLAMLEIIGNAAYRRPTNLERFKQKGNIQALLSELHSKNVGLSIQAFITLANINIQLADIKRDAGSLTSENQECISTHVDLLLKKIVPKFEIEFHDDVKKYEFALDLLRNRPSYISGRVLVNEALLLRLENDIKSYKKKREPSHNLAHDPENTSLSFR